jgi:hypothetical protein
VFCSFPKQQKNIETEFSDMRRQETVCLKNVATLANDFVHSLSVRQIKNDASVETNRLTQDSLLIGVIPVKSCLLISVIPVKTVF